MQALCKELAGLLIPSGVTYAENPNFMGFQVEEVSRMCRGQEQVGTQRPEVVTYIPKTRLV